MLSNRKHYRQRFSLIAALLLLLSLVTPPVAGAQDANQEVREADQVADAKLNDRLMDEFEESDEVRFIIKFKKQADTKQAAEEGVAKANAEDAASNQALFLQRSSVVSALKSTAKESQRSVADYLGEEADAGNAADIRPYFIVNGMAVTATKEVAQKIASFVEVEKVLPNEKRELFVSDVSDSEVESDDDIEWNIERVQAPDVWDNGIDGTGAVVASIDTGAEWDHPALKEQYRGYDPETGDVDHDFNWFDATEGASEPYDDVGHGTHVTGTMAGMEADGSNQIGVAPGAKWISVKAFTEEGGEDDDLLAAAEWILAPEDEDGNTRVDMAPDVVNNSWGGGKGKDEWYRDVVKSWGDADIFPEFSAGNTDMYNPGGPGSIASPANYPESFATGATDQDDDIAEFSLRGPSPYEEIKPDIAAPGVSIRSAVPGKDYGLKDGTSMAGPAVSGVVALLRQADSGISVDDMEEILLDTAEARTDDEYPDTPNNGYGHGIVNALDAVSYIMDGLGTVEGTVSEQGEDNEEPEFDHDAPAVVYEDMDTDLTINATDNISVLSVELSYQINDGERETVDAELTSGDYTDGEYAVTLPGEELEKGELTYHWTIRDYGGNDVTSDEYVVDIGEGITTGYFEDFESDPDGWHSFGDHDSWEWGEPESGPEVAKTGENVYATNLDGTYPNDSDATLVMPAVDMPEGEAYLQFDWWYDLEEVHDYAWVYISEDQEEWKSKKVGYYDTDGWERVEIDLSEYSGKRIYIGFNLESKVNYEVVKPGIYVDNVGLSSTSESSNASLMQRDLPMIENGNAVEDSLSADENNTRTMIVNESAEEDVQADVVDLPLDAEVSVLETGRSSKTDPSDGSYSISSLVPGNYTLEAEAYGFYPEEADVSVDEDENVSQDFTLDEIPEGTLSGKVTDEDTGEPIEDATLSLVEDANVTPVETDENGKYDLSAYEGTYTLKVIANGYHQGEVEVTIDEDTQGQDIELEPFYEYRDDEIHYDDGSMEGVWALYESGTSMAVKMSLPEEQDTALVTDGVFQFEGPQFQDPEGGAFAVEVWDSSGKDGLPGEKLAGPIDADALRDPDEWTVIDLSDENIMVDDDFYMVYVQTEENEFAPLLGVDKDKPYAGRTYQGEPGGVWTQLPADKGNYMIRARVSYEVETPEITNPEDGLITGEEEVSIEGTATTDTDMKLMNGDEEIDVVTVTEDGAFSLDATLDEGDNELTAVTLVDDEETEISDAVTVTLDTVAPELSIDKPADGEKTNRETVTVEGTAKDEHLESVTVNGEEATVDDDGSYSKRILLDNGENDIEVIAKDEAGNETSETVTLDVKYDAPEVENVLPDQEQSVSTGESVKVEMDSEPGLDATFSIHMPLTNNSQVSNATELPMIEESDGHYVGYWTVQKGAVADGAVIEVKAKDSYGNETREEAEGKLLINQDDDGEVDASSQVSFLP